ncbi:AAA family ATPase [Vibrio splendidus]|uniref:AAA family ATPase n=1 Tax=Vibrio splendidus TaxID=29497 RepID=UPI00352F10A0
MLIKRLRVEEGFFNLLDLQFSQGLNVLVGGRGVGKTSIIELLRFGLGVSNLSDGASRESTAHAVSILQSSGRVIIDVEVNGQVLTVTRSATDSVTSNIAFLPKPIIFSQKEIETVSLNSEGKLNLIDSFVSSTEYESQQINQVCSEIKSLYANMMHVKRELDEAHSHTVKKNELLAQEVELVNQQKVHESQNASMTSNQEQYNLLEKELVEVEGEINNSNYLLQVFESRIAQLNSLMSKNNNQFSGTLQSSRVKELYSLANELIEQESTVLGELINKNHNFMSKVQSELNNFFMKKNKLEEKARSYRGEISKITEIAGVVLSRLSQIRTQLSQVSSWEQVANSKSDQISAIYEQIQAKLGELSSLRTDVFNKRLSVVNELNNSLNPFVNIEIEHSSDQSDYSEALKSALKGSGLRYNEIVDSITSKIHPQWLFYYVFAAKYDEFASMVNMPFDRATRLLSYLKEIDLGNLLATKIDDQLNFYLLDRGSYKRVEELSIGQRCTVALSIILENKSRVLIIDQPEDHLDNEFIANTLINSLVKRASGVQTILSSHNANIPVLGNASTVVNLDSNGRKGFVKHSGPVEQADIRKAIESIMEGGKNAFQRRAHFYSGS